MIKDLSGDENTLTMKLDDETLRFKLSLEFTDVDRGGHPAQAGHGRAGQSQCGRVLQDLPGLTGNSTDGRQHEATRWLHHWSWPNGVGSAAVRVTVQPSASELSDVMRSRFHRGAAVCGPCPQIWVSGPCCKAGMSGGEDACLERGEGDSGAVLVDAEHGGGAE